MMTSFEISLLGVRVVSAILIAVGIRAIACRRVHTSPPCSAFWAGIALWLLAELAETPVLGDLVVQVPEWVWVGLLATITSGALVCTLTLRVFGARGGRDDLACNDPVRSAAGDSNHIHEEAWS